MNIVSLNKRQIEATTDICRRYAVLCGGSNHWMSATFKMARNTNALSIDMEKQYEEYPAPDVTTSQYVSTMTHFYRGELGRMMEWRRRFDATANWAIVGTGSLFAFAVRNADMLNEAMLINLIVLGFFSFIEARRYRFYDAFRARVRMLEVHFIAPTLIGGERRPLEGEWRTHLVEDLIMPSSKCTFAFALGRRFRHIYGALHLFVLFGWGALASFDARSLGGWVNSFELGRMAGWMVLMLVALYFSGLVIAIVRSGALGAESGEVRRYQRGVQWSSLLSEKD